MGRARRRRRLSTFALVKRSKDGDAGYNPIVETDELDNTLTLFRYDGEHSERGAVWSLVVTEMGESEIMPAESIMTPGSGLLKLTGALGDVRPKHIPPG